MTYRLGTLGAAACIHKPQEIPRISIIVSRFGYLFWTKGLGSPWWLVAWLLQQKPMSRLFDFTVAWNHGPIGGVETVKGYVRFNLKVNRNGFQVAGLTMPRREFWHFRGRGWCCLCSLSNQQHIVRGTAVKRTAQLFQFGSGKHQRHVLVVVVLPGRLVQWYGIQSKPWNYPETGLLQDSQTCLNLSLPLACVHEQITSWLGLPWWSSG